MVSAGKELSFVESNYCVKIVISDDTEGHDPTETEQR
jgi:hypothetical protein